MSSRTFVIPESEDENMVRPTSDQLKEFVEMSGGEASREFVRNAVEEIIRDREQIAGYHALVSEMVEVYGDLIEDVKQIRDLIVVKESSIGLTVEGAAALIAKFDEDYERFLDLAAHSAMGWSWFSENVGAIDRDRVIRLLGDLVETVPEFAEMTCDHEVGLCSCTLQGLIAEAEGVKKALAGETDYSADGAAASVREAKDLVRRRES